MQHVENPYHTHGSRYGDCGDGPESYDPRERLERDGIQGTLESLLYDARTDAPSCLRECTYGEVEEYGGCWWHDGEAALDACTAERARTKKTTVTTIQESRADVAARDADDWAQRRADAEMLAARGGK